MSAKPPPWTVALAFDTDWVPQFVLDDILARVRAHDVAATFFCTSPYDFDPDSPHEKAWHPNFLPGSTQGDTVSECLAYLKALYPGATGSRSHCLFWHSRLREPLLEAGIRYDASTFCPLQPHLQPWRFNDLWFIPVWWADGMHMEEQRPLDTFPVREAGWPGLKACVFHPIHVYLNSRSLVEARAALGNMPLHEVAEEDLRSLRRAGIGVETLFDKFLAWASRQERPALFRDLLPPTVVSEPDAPREKKCYDRIPL